jgi:hypothetical protein
MCSLNMIYVHIFARIIDILRSRILFFLGGGINRISTSGIQSRISEAVIFLYHLDMSYAIPVDANRVTTSFVFTVIQRKQGSRPR